MKLLNTVLIIVLAAASSSCTDMIKNLFDSPTKPSETTTTSGGVRSYLGTWTGPSAAPASQSCSGLQWKITSQTGSQASGDFAATCSNGISLTGTVTATHSDTTIPWAATGTATKDETVCPFSMTGSGTFQGTSHIVVNYAATSCLGPLSGSETITR